MGHRFSHIDIVRSVGILGVILVHILSYHLSRPSYFFFWNYLHFVEVAFVFCSGYVLTARLHGSLVGKTHLFSWYQKRIVRLFVPYALYLIFHYGLWLTLPGLFSGLGISKDPSFIFASIFLTGGVSHNWLVLLFIELMLVYPLFLYALSRKIIFFLLGALFLAIAAGFTFFPLPSISYRWTMWTSWSLVLLVSMAIAHAEKKSKPHIVKYLIGFVFCLSAFFAISQTEVIKHSTQTLFAHKYPPDLYYLLYASGMSAVLIAISYIPFLSSGVLSLVWKYISTHSYELYFIHFIVIDFIMTMTRGVSFWSQMGVQFICVTAISFFVCVILDTIRHIQKKS